MSNPSKPKNLPFILFNGYPATGKLTIAHHLRDLLRAQSIDALIFQNEFRTSDATAMRAEHSYQDQRANSRAGHFYVAAQPPDAISIFIEFQIDDPIGRRMLEQYWLGAARFRKMLAHVNLECSGEENERRLACQQTSTSNVADEGSVNVELLRYWREAGGLAKSNNREGEVTCETVNVGDMGAPEAAQKIFEIVAECFPAARK
jgi:hypothetical protein